MAQEGRRQLPSSSRAAKIFSLLYHGYSGDFFPAVHRLQVSAA
jgi:hypothetical protein